MATFDIAYFSQIVVNGLHMSMLYAALAYGYVLGLSVTHRANLAHGVVFAFAGQVAVLGANLGYQAFWMTVAESILFGAAVAAVLTSIVLGVLAQVVMPRFIARNPNMMIAATLALSIVVVEAVRIGSDARDLWLPPVLAQPVFLGNMENAPRLTQLQVINLAALFITLVMAETWINRSSAGRKLRAVADDPLAASLCGVNGSRVVATTVMAGGLLAGLAGLLAVVHYGNMSFGAGFVFSLKVLFIASAGGFSRPVFAACGAFAYGLAESLWDGYFPTQWRDMVFIAVLAIILCLRTENRIAVTHRA